MRAGPRNGKVLVLSVLKSLLFWGAGAVVVLILLAWLLLESALFAGLRTGFAENLLSKELGRPIEIEGDLRVSPGRTLFVVAEGISLPSGTAPHTELASLASLEFRLATGALWQGKISASGVVAKGAQINLIFDESGKSSWDINKLDQQPKKATDGNTRASLDLLSDRKLKFEKANVLYQDARNGLDLNLQLSNLSLQQDDPTAPFVIEGTGNLNGESLNMTGSFPTDAPLSAEIAFEHVRLTATGAQVSDGNQTIALSADVQKLSQLLDILKLQKPVDGTGQVSALFSTGPTANRIDKLSVNVAFDGGQSVEVTGNIGELGNPEDVSLTTRIRLYPEGKEPPKTRTRRDLKLIAVDMVIDSVPGQVAQRSMQIVTNGFVIDTQGEGPPPISFGKFSRSSDGKLKIGKINLRIGKPEDPFLILDGSADDALALAGIRATGTLDMPAGSLVAPELFQDSTHLGRLTGGFILEGDIDQLGLRDLSAKTQDTDLWTLDVSGKVKNVVKFQDVDLNVRVDVPSTSALLAAMNLEPVETDPTFLSLRLTSEGSSWDGEAHINLDTTNLDLHLDLDDAITNPVVKGLVKSALIKTDHIKHIIDVIVQLRRLNPPELPPESEVTVEKPDDSKEDGIFRDVTLLPIGQAVLISGMDAQVDIDLQKIEGAKGVTSLQTSLLLDKDQLRAGPFEFEYDGAKFDLTGNMDLSKDDQILELAGTAGGWNLKEILSLLHFKKAAGGTLYANFDISGPTQSLSHFIAGMNGSATVSMNNGFIQSQLLDLAGLGILPWLFSGDTQKNAAITCLRVPVSITDGRISTSRAAIETNQVQIVVYGDVDLAHKRLDIHGQPRKIGEPLSRSPWPFTVSGALAKPDVKVKDGPKKLKRKDGADTMPNKRKPCVPDILQLQ